MELLFSPDEFAIGGDIQTVNVSIDVVNSGEDAFEAAIYITEPMGLKFKKYEPLDAASCSTRRLGPNTYIVCDIGNPLPANSEVGLPIKHCSFVINQPPAEKFQCTLPTIWRFTRAIF